MSAETFYLMSASKPGNAGEYVCGPQREGQPQGNVIVDPAEAELMFQMVSKAVNEGRRPHTVVLRLIKVQRIEIVKEIVFTKAAQTSHTA